MSDKRPDWIEPPDPGMPDPKIKYHLDGVTVSEVTYYKSAYGPYHRTNGPAFLSWRADGTRLMEVWFQEGKYHHPTKEYAMTSWKRDGTIKNHDFKSQLRNT